MTLLINGKAGKVPNPIVPKKETEKEKREDDDDPTAITSEIARGLEIEEGGNRDEIVAGRAQALKEGGRRHHEGKQIGLQPQPLTVRMANAARESSRAFALRPRKASPAESSQPLVKEAPKKRYNSSW